MGSMDLRAVAPTSRRIDLEAHSSQLLAPELFARGHSLALSARVRCPECDVTNDDAAGACSQCGLLLAKLAPPRRRRDDFQQERRRASDAAAATCPYCHGEISADAVRCRHCSEYVNAQFRAEALARKRSRINYASWVAYIFGLLAFLVFRPVGLIAIGAGLLLSILYYAIPIDLPQNAPATAKIRAWFQSSFERVSIPLPHLSRVRLVFVGTPLIVALIGFMVNFFFLQQPLNRVLQSNPAYARMKISAHYEYWVVPGAVAFDLRGIDVNQSRLDVHAVLVEYARALRSRRVERVDLQYRGTTRFSISGDTFRRLGMESEKKNFPWVLYEFPRLVGKGAVGDGADALLKFHDRWYADDVLQEAFERRLAGAS